jgi:phosphoglycolate phosphatase-like HAD superfamily hydrolase
MNRTVLIRDDTLLDRAALRAALPRAWGRALADGQGGSPDEWADAYRRIQDDWDSYWADLDLSGDDSLAQWREGRWRVVRGLFRLAGRAAPPVEQLPYYLDEFPCAVGRLCPAWVPGMVETLNRLDEQGIEIVLLTPYISSTLIWGMLNAVDLQRSVKRVLGPDELGQVGLEGIDRAYLSRLAGAAHLTPPDDLFTLIRQPHHQREEP